MRKKRIIISIILSLSLILGSWSGVFALSTTEMPNADGNQQSAKEMLSEGEYAKDKLIVTFEEGVTNGAIKKEVKKEDAVVEDITEITDTEKVAMVEISDEDTMAEAIEKLQDNSRIVSVQPNYKYTINENDPLVGNKSGEAYQLDKVKAKEAWSLLGTSYSKTKVAVLDTGCDVLHEDLQASLNKADSYSLNAGNVSQLTEDTDSHGTHVSGIIGATYNNGKGIAGIASGENNDMVELTVMGISEDGENLYSFDCISGINKAKEVGAKVVNMSWGGYARDRALEAAIQDGYYNYDMVFVAAAGNGDLNLFSSPSDIPEVISVCATNENNKAVYWSDYGIAKDVSAPGNNIMSTVPADSYELMSGTSMASPVTTGVVALMRDANPNLTAAQIKNILCATCEDIVENQETDIGFDVNTGYGLIQADKAVEAAKTASTEIGATGLELKESQIDEIISGQSHCIESLVTPATSLQQVTWRSDDTGIATVDDKGNVIGISDGTTNIRATVNGITKTCKVTVTGSIEATGINIDEKAETMTVGHQVELSATIAPNNVTNTEVHWSSSDNSVAAIDSNYPVVTARKKGTVTITAETWDGKQKDSYELVVLPLAEEVEFTKQVSWIHLGDKATFGAKVLPEDADSTITWASSNRYIATVSKDGVVTPVKAGTVYIKAIAASGVKTYKKINILKSTYSKNDYKLKVSKKTKTTNTIKWSSIPAASGYEIYKKTSKNGTYKKIATTKNRTYTDKKLKTKKTYYYKVRSWYVKDGNQKYYGYSNVVKVVK